MELYFENSVSNIALSDEYGQEVSYKLLREISDKFIKFIPKCELTLVISKQEIGSLIGSIGLIQANRPAMLLDGSIVESDLANFIERWKPSYFWAPDNYSSFGFYKKLLCFHGYSLFEVKSGSIKYTTTHPELLLLVGTSGFSGPTKWARISRTNLESSCSSILKFLPIDQNSSTITSLPFHYIYGLSVVLTHLVKGGRILVTTASLIQKDFWESARKQGITNLNGTPFHYKCIAKLGILNRSWPELKFITQAGGKLDEKHQFEIAQIASNRGLDFYLMYGQTEATSRISYLNPKKAKIKIGSVGQPVEGGAIELRDDSGNLVDEPYQIGQIIFKSKQVCMGYATKLEDLILNNEFNDTLRTGDLGYLDEDGDLFIKGRISRFVKMFGIRVGLDELESSLAETFTVSEFACVGTDDSLCTFYTGAISESSVLDALSKISRQNKTVLKAIRLISLPILPSGKINQSLLKQLHEYSIKPWVKDWVELDSSNDNDEYLNRLTELTSLHFMRCESYRRILHTLGFDINKKPECVEELPYIPVSLFKSHKLLSIEQSSIVKTVRSSGTSVGAMSQIFLDKYNAQSLQHALILTANKFINLGRMPMLVVDSESLFDNRSNFNARAAAISGFSIFSKERLFALDDDLKLKLKEVEKFFDEHAGLPVLIFGFTPIIWKYFLNPLHQLKLKINLNKAILIHGGGWKKMLSQSVSKNRFTDFCKNTIGIEKVHEYYGMVEQTGSIFFRCDHNRFHCGPYSEVIIRNPHDLSPCSINEQGIIQCLSALPTSYCGHSLLTEDQGVLLGKNDCPCGKPGTTFDVLGRFPNVALKGCGDTHEQ